MQALFKGKTCIFALNLYKIGKKQSKVPVNESRIIVCRYFICYTYFYIRVI